FSHGSITDSIIVEFYSHGEIRVYAQNECGNSNTISKQILAYASPMTDIIGEQNICKGATNITYTSYATENASYEWFLPEGVIGESSTNEIIVSFSENAVSGNISVRHTNLCGFHDTFLFVN